MKDQPEIRVSATPGEVRVAGLRGGVLEVAAVERTGRPDGVGDLHLARVSALAAAMSGAFLTLQDGTTAFLPEGELPPPRRPIAQALQEGQALPVRLIRAAQGGKGPRATARLSAAELALAATTTGSAPLLLRRGDDTATRLARDWPNASVVTDNARLAASLGARIGKGRVSLVLGTAFDAELEAAFEDLLSPFVALKDGARLVIQPTSALTAIDVDTGPAAGSRDPMAHKRVNALAILEVARQIRLRNLAGAILVDFAGLSVRQREALVAPMAAALLVDPLKPRLLGLTGLGLMEIVRPRIHPPLHEILGTPPTPLTRGLAALRQALRESAASQGTALALRAAPEVIAALSLEAGVLAAYREATGRSLVLEPDPRLRPGQEQVAEPSP
ncbi:ribonuclease E/G [Falsiroseomonas sp. E2-1-a20]|uniref:ribonuclease E/G n=1 Tax=Falsiroseomonas sp. E2-1-a20 TaxID=3239300 RepID=UPI003F3D3622